jgi:DNA polymerase-3 subunit alpha
MKLAQDIAGFTLGQADLLRRACGKKKMSEMVKHEAMFTDGVVSQGHPKELASELWQILLNSAEYCLDYNTKVLTVQYGYIAIGEIVEQKLECDVFSVDANGLIYTQPIAQWHNRGGKDVFRYETDSGLVIFATPDHKFMTKYGKLMPIDDIFEQDLDLMIMSELAA